MKVHSSLGFICHRLHIRVYGISIDKRGKDCFIGEQGIGGGMTKSADKFLPAVIENYKAMSHTALHNTPFVIAMLDEPGIIGAAMLPRREGS